MERPEEHVEEREVDREVLVDRLPVDGMVPMVEVEALAVVAVEVLLRVVTLVALEALD